MGAEPSQIFGQLKANGQVFLINPNGVLFAPGAQVNVHGLLATTMDTPDADFMAGTPHFTGKAGSVRNDGSIHADAGGFVSLLGGLVTNTGDIAVVNTQGVVPAQGLVMRDGGIELVGDVVHQAGTLDASGLNGGLVSLSGRSVLQDGLIQANGSLGTGGQVHISASSTLLQTQAAQISADGATTGGQISLSSEQTAYLSGTSHANGGQNGGQIDIQTTGLLSVAGAHLSAMGEAGRIVLMSQADTRFAATATTGPKGFIEISGKGTLYMGGSTDPGLGGQTLLDPTNIVIGPASTTLSYIDLANPNPAAADQHGSGGTVEVGGGNIVVASPNDNFGGIGSTGAVYLYNGTTGALISTLFGTVAGDLVGSGGVTKLSNGNYAVSSPTWAGNLGAVTWMNGLIASSGTVSAANSLVGTTPGDQVGFGGVTALTNGNYVVNSPLWSANTGAITWMDGLGNTNPGTVSPLSSLVGAQPGDKIGSGMDGLGRGGITALTNGNYVVNSPLWGGTLGAVTWMSGTASSVGTVSAANSLIGNVAGDLLGIGGIAALTNGNYAISSPMWSNGAITNTGAVSLGDGTLGSVGTVGSTPSLMGTLANDNLGWDGLIPLSTGGFVILSSNYAGGFGAAWVVTATTGLMPDYTPAQLAAMAPLGSTLTLAATNAITVNAPVVVDGALTLNAGNTLTLNAPITSNAASASALVMVAGQSFVNNAGANALSTPNGNWQVWSANPAADTRGGLVYGFKQYNATYGVTTPAQATGNGLFYSLAPLLSPSLSGAALKTYDGNATAPITNLLLTATGAVDGDVVALSALSANYATPAPNVATGLQVTASGISATASNGLAPVYGYQMASTTATALGIGQITPMSLTVSGTTAANKVYDATTTATLTGGTLLGTVAGTGVIPGDTLVLQQSGSFLDKNVGTNKPVNVINTLGGASAGNYVLNTLTQATIASITPATLNVNGTVVAPKVYDASLTAAIGTPGTLATVLGTDQVLLGQTALFTNKNVNTAQVATVTNTLSGLDAGNYILANRSVNTTAAITPAMLNVNGTAIASKVYDAGVQAPISTPGTLSTVLGNDFVFLGQSAQFTTKNVGSAKPVTVTNTLSGPDAGNYLLNTPSFASTSNITPAVLTLNGTAVANKIYDATLAATIGTPGVLGGVLANDGVSVTQFAAFGDKNVGQNKPVMVNSTLAGPDASNYVLSTPSLSATATITPATLNVNGTVVAPTKVYDATLQASLITPGALAPVFANDQVSLNQAALFIDKNVGPSKAVTVTNTLTGADAGNYVLATPTLSTSATITPATLNVNGLQVSPKVFDGTLTAVVSSTLGNVLPNDQVTLNQMATFADPTIGNAKPVSIVNSLTGPDAGNYVLSTGTQVGFGNIVPPPTSSCPPRCHRYPPTA
ncbi:filamentous hemagglutinin family N-terminal domain protein, partial [Leptothrix ochracea L12]